MDLIEFVDFDGVFYAKDFEQYGIDPERIMDMFTRVVGERPKAIGISGEIYGGSEPGRELFLAKIVTSVENFTIDHDNVKEEATSIAVSQTVSLPNFTDQTMPLTDNAVNSVSNSRKVHIEGTVPAKGAIRFNVKVAKRVHVEKEYGLEVQINSGGEWEWGETVTIDGGLGSNGMDVPPKKFGSISYRALKGDIHIPFTMDFVLQGGVQADMGKKVNGHYLYSLPVGYIFDQTTSPNPMVNTLFRKKMNGIITIKDHLKITFVPEIRDLTKQDYINNARQPPEGLE